MRYWVLLIICMLIGSVHFACAQVTADTEQIQRLERGQYSFAKGEIQVTFIDSVSPDFIEKRLESLGYEPISLNIHRVKALIQNEPTLGELAHIEQNPDIYSIEISQNSIPERALQEMFERDSLTIEEQKAARKRFEAFAERKYIKVLFQYDINKEEATKLLNEYPEIDFKISMAPIKTGRKKTEVGEEEKVMKRIEGLLFVKSTAYIGILNQ